MKENKAKILLFELYVVLFWLSIHISSPFISKYAEQIGAGSFLVGLTVALYSIGQISLRVPAGIFADRKNMRKETILLGALIAAVSFALLWLMPTIPVLIIARTMQGISAASTVCAQAMYVGFYPNDEAFQASGKLVAVNQLGTASAYLFAALVGNAVSIKGIFILSTIFGICSFISLAIVKDDKKKKEPVTGQDLKKAFQSPRLLLVALTCAVIELVEAGAVWTYVPFIAADMGGSPFWLSMLQFSFVIPCFIANKLFYKKLIRTFSPTGMLLAFTCTESVLCMLLPHTRSLFILFVVLFIMGTVHWTSFQLLSGLAITSFPEKMHACAMGVFQATYALGMLVGPIVAGTVRSVASMTVVFITLGLMTLLTPMYVLFVKKIDKKASNDAEILSE